MSPNNWDIVAPGSINRTAFPSWSRFVDGSASIVTDHEIRPNQPMPALGRFDVVTAYRAQFNRSNGRLWSIDEWSFFLDDLRDNVLKPGGRLVIKFAKQDLKAARGGLSPSDPLLQRFLESRGAVTSDGITDFNPLI